MRATTQRFVDVVLIGWSLSEKNHLHLNDALCATKVTFAEREGSSASRQEISVTERTTVVKGERTMTHKGDSSLASDLPSAQEDFEQVCQQQGIESNLKTGTKIRME